MDLLGEGIRYVEANVLDKYYEKQPLLQRCQIEAVSHLLKVYGNLVREFDAAELLQLATNTWLTEQNLWSRALEQSLRWVLKHCKPSSTFSKDPWRTIDEEALLLLSWARSYVKLCDDHTSASRGLCVASLNEDLHEIRFQLKDTAEFNVYLSQMAAHPLHVNEVFKEFPSKELDNLFNQWKSKINFDKLDEPESLPLFENNFSHPNQIPIKQWTRLTILPELDDCENLNGFTLGDLRDFWACLFLECKLIARLENHVDNVVGDENDLGSVMLQGSLVEVSEYLANSFKIDAQVILEIINCLTFDQNSHKSTLSNSPFIKTECGTMSLLCRLVIGIDPYIMIASALAKRSRKLKLIYETLIHKIEKVNVIHIGERFRNLGFTVLTEEVLTGKDNSKICPDLIVYDQESHQILVADYKHAIPPIGASEVGNRILDLEKWKEQIRRYLQFFDKNEEMIRGRLGCKSTAQIYGMLLFRWEMVIPVPIETDITYADWLSLSDILKKIEKPIISEISRFFRLPRDADQVACHWEVGEESIQVDKWTYRRPIIILNPE